MHIIYWINTIRIFLSLSLPQLASAQSTPQPLSPSPIPFLPAWRQARFNLHLPPQLYLRSSCCSHSLDPCSTITSNQNHAEEEGFMHCVHFLTFQIKLSNQELLVVVVEQFLPERLGLSVMLEGMSTNNMTESTHCTRYPTGLFFFTHETTFNLSECRSVSAAESCKNDWEERYSTSLTQWIVPLGCTEEKVQRSLWSKVWLSLEYRHPLCWSLAAASHISPNWTSVRRQNDNVSHKIATT